MRVPNSLLGFFLLRSLTLDYEQRLRWVGGEPLQVDLGAVDQGPQRLIRQHSRRPGTSGGCWDPGLLGVWSGGDYRRTRRRVTVLGTVWIVIRVPECLATTIFPPPM